MSSPLRACGPVRLVWMETNGAVVVAARRNVSTHNESRFGGLPDVWFQERDGAPVN